MSVSTPSTACWSWDARITSAPLDPGRGRGQCARDPDPCNTVAGVVENEHDEALASRPGLARKQRQQRGEEWLGDAVRYVPEGLAGDRLHEGGHVQPLIAVMAERDGPLAFGAHTR